MQSTGKAPRNGRPETPPGIDISGKALLPGLAGQPSRRRHRTGSGVGRRYPGAAAVHEVVVAAKEIYEFQDFHYAGPCRQSSFLEDYTSSVRGVPLYVIVLVVFNAAGKAQRLVVNHRPRSSVLVLSRVMFERLAGTPLAKHSEGTP
jgi:hypothetical protein